MLKINPDALEVANSYLSTLSIEETSKQLEITPEAVNQYIQQPAVKSYIDNIFLEQGYRNRFKLGALLDKIIDSKLEEAEETGVYTSKDLLEVIKVVQTMQKDNTQSQDIGKQTNVQVNNYGANLSSLLERIVEGK